MGIYAVDSFGNSKKMSRIWEVNKAGIATPVKTVYRVTDTGVSSMVYPDLCTISDLSPTAVTRNANTVITLTGTGFYSAQNVYLSGINANVAVTIINDTTLQFTVPTSLYEGTVTLYVRNARGNSNSKTFTSYHPMYYLLNPASAGLWTAYGDSRSSWSVSGTQIWIYTPGYNEVSIYAPYFSYAGYNQIYLNASITSITSSELTANVNQYRSSVTVYQGLSFNAWNTLAYNGAAYLRFGRYANNIAGYSYLYQVVLRKTN